MRVFIIAMMSVAFSVIALDRADAASEICPANVADSHAFAADAAGTLYAFVLDAASERSVRGTIVVATNAGYFTFAFPETTFVLDHAIYRTPTNEYFRDRYVTTPFYVRFPASVTNVSTWWVTIAQTTGEKLFGWDKRGVVACPLMQSEPALKPIPKVQDQVTRISRLPYDLASPPPANALVSTATATSAPGDTTCAVPFSGATAIKMAAPDFPESVAETLTGTMPLVTDVVEVFLDEKGAVVDTTVIQPSPYPALDQAAIAAVRHSTFRPEISFCKPIPSTYLFQTEFNSDM
jgi:TonB family protein